MTQTLITLIISMAPHFGIEPELAVAVARTESSLNPQAVGPFDEIGLFQVRPKYSKFSRSELFNPVLNISEGLRMLAEAKARCKHQIERSWLVCYNAGITGGSRIKNPKQFAYYTKVMSKMGN